MLYCLKNTFILLLDVNVRMAWNTHVKRLVRVSFKFRTDFSSEIPNTRVRFKAVEHRQYVLVLLWLALLMRQAVRCVHARVCLYVNAHSRTAMGFIIDLRNHEYCVI